MRAVTIEGGKGPATALRVEQVATPIPRAGQILIRVRAAGVNRPDIVQREGRYPPPPGAPEILGLEVAGEVAAVGADTARWTIGDRVTALLPGGGYAEFAAVDGRHALPLPSGLDFVQSAALPETVFTVWSNVFERGALRAGETLLVHGANSGIGVTAIQMAKAAGARVIATARGEAKTAQARSMGGDLALDTTGPDWAAEVKAAGGADVVLDMVGATFFAANVEVPPEKLAGFFEDTQKIAEDLRTKEIGPDELARAKKPRIDGLLKAKVTNGYWLNELSGAQA